MKTQMRFIREIPANLIKDKDMSLDQEGFTLVWKADSLEIWAEVKETNLADLMAA